MLIQLVLSAVLHGDTSAEGMVSLFNTCRAPFELPSSHVHAMGQHACPHCQTWPVAMQDFSLGLMLAACTVSHACWKPFCTEEGC